MQRRTRGRHVNGILLLDKPQGITSNAALQQVKRLFEAKKAGHTGSLDPLATGMLPICFGESTKFSQFLLNANKTYEVTAKLGIKTATADSEGDIIQERPVPKKLSTRLFQATLKQFTGDIEQIPSMFSAIKVNGKPLYELARKGIEIERAPRQITIYELALLGYTEDTFSIRVFCSKGTYVRNLVEDIGEVLGCGAHVIALRRLSTEPYGDAVMHSLDSLQALSDDAGRTAKLDQLLLPMESAISHYPKVTLTANTAFYLRQGQAVRVPKLPTSGEVRLYLEGSHFIGVGEVADGMVTPRRLVTS